jgi:tetratricopeptide (TPR) repeat protein
LLNGLKTETPEVRDLARRALEYSWFRAAGSEANRVVEDAFEAATKKDYQTALSLLNKVVKKYPKYAEGWNRRASLYWQMGEYQKSIADCQTAIALNPNHYGAWQGIGVCHVHLGEISEACRCLRIALKIAPYDETTRHALQKCEDLLKVIQGTDKDARKGQLI